MYQLALVFKCASDTVFLDDFKSVLDVIVGKALRKVGGAVISGQRQSSGAVAYHHKRDDHLEPDKGSRSKSSVTTSAANASSLDNRELNDMHLNPKSNVDPSPTSSRPMWKQSLFPKREDTVVRVPKLKIRRDITITTSLHDGGVRSNSAESFNSKERFLLMPERTYAGDDRARSGSQSRAGTTNMIESIPH